MVPDRLKREDGTHQTYIEDARIEEGIGKRGGGGGGVSRQIKKIEEKREGP